LPCDGGDEMDHISNCEISRSTPGCALREIMTQSRIQQLALTSAVYAVLACQARATIAVSFDILDASEPGGPAPPGRLVVDAFLDFSADSYLTAAGVTGRSLNGATLIYNSEPTLAFLPPGLTDHYVTFGSAAYGRAGGNRFAPQGTVALQ